MRITTALTTAVTSALAATVIAAAGPASAAPVNHHAAARADWTKAAHSAVAAHNRFWDAARDQLANYGKRDAHEMADLTALTKIPGTSTTAAQRAETARLTSDLNGYFHTPGLYGYPASKARSYARAEWIRSARVAAANEAYWFASAIDEMDTFSHRFPKVRHDLAQLETIPLTNTTAKQRATAHKDAHALDTFFHTPGLNY